MIKKHPFFIILILTILSLVIIPKTAHAATGEGTLIKGLSEKVYVIENGLKRWIQTADIFNKLRYSWTNIRSVSEKFLNDVPPGKDVANDYQYPNGTLLRGSGPEVYLVENELRRWIPNPQIFNAKGFKWQNIIQALDEIVNGIRKGNDISSY